ncbi:AraC family transcriptional regulator [Aureispira anguillae]|uniref:AraC family transcriptional regulator n=1 Tax=Aureispira anguillae TaxID=2864201 RepID=A0A916DRP5_9BACT|nr:AraC family transcriptional regulator [Aureispira anguillae]BDS11391.1 AraC family transcriptional regulator [Aureispira anguillae]
MHKSSEIYRSRINRVIDYVNDNLDKSISLEELAAVAFFSPFHFHRIFVAVTGESVNYFTNRIRLEKTARLLRFSTYSISEIGMSCGFSSPSTFSRAFKQYFGISPSFYRKGGKIENSKIRKELFPLKDYLVPMSETALKTNFPVAIRQFSERRVAYIRVLDSYREGVVINAFKKLVAWAKKMNLFHSEKIFGMSIDDPMITPKEKYRYEVCITLPTNFKMDARDCLEIMILPKCKYAVASVSGDFNRVATATHYLYNNWLINSSFEPDHQPGLEIFLDKENICNWDYLELELCIPIKNIKTY